MSTCRSIVQAVLLIRGANRHACASLTPSSDNFNLNRGMTMNAGNEKTAIFRMQIEKNRARVVDRDVPEEEVSRETAIPASAANTHTRPLKRGCARVCNGGWHEIIACRATPEIAVNGKNRPDIEG
ncbi:MAG: hypothetical protein KDJ67_00650 [Nitratireductor sp.]|nr:hypothetical protein [Nitratireductor sp.]